MKQDYKIQKYNWHSNKNTDGLVNRLASNLAILNQAHRVAWLIGQEKILKYLGELDKEKYINIHIYIYTELKNC